MATMCGDQGLLGVKKDLLQDLMGVKDCLDHEFDEFQQEQELDIKNVETDGKPAEEQKQEKEALKQAASRSQSQKRKSRRQKSWSLPNSPMNDAQVGANNDDEEPLHHLSPVQEETESLRQEQSKKFIENVLRSNTQDDMGRHKSTIQKLEKLMNSDLESLPTPRTVERMLQNEEAQDNLSLEKLGQQAKNEMMKNQDNDFNSSLFPDSVVDRNKGSNLFEGEDEGLIGEGLGSESIEGVGDIFNSAMKEASPQRSSPRAENSKVQGPAEHVRTSEITEFSIDKLEGAGKALPGNTSGAHESLVKTDQEIAQDLEDKVIAVSDLDEELEIEEGDENSNAIETIIEADEEDYDDEESVPSAKKKRGSVSSPNRRKVSGNLAKTQAIKVTRKSEELKAEQSQ